MKLELGAGHRSTRGYIHNDIYPFDGVDIVAKAWDVDLPDESLDEVLALAFIEHLTYYEAFDTFRNVARMLKPGGSFLFDVPDYPVWCRYYLTRLNGETTPVSMEHIRKTLFGWARWPGDEHKSGWDAQYLNDVLSDCGLQNTGRDALADLQRRHIYRARFHNPDDAHIYVHAMKPL